MEILEHPVLGELVGAEVKIFFEGKELSARSGQTVAAALMAHGVYTLGRSRKQAQARGVYCANGRCHSCLMTIDHVKNIRACSTVVREGMDIRLNSGDPDLWEGQDGN